MKQIQNKHIIILLLSVFLLTSCRSKKKTFNGTEKLDCANYDESLNKSINKKSTTKWKLILYKDGEKVGGKSKRGKSRLFKNKK